MVRRAGALPSFGLALAAAAPAWAGTTERVSVGTGGVQADGLSLRAALSADGRFVAFESAADNLVRGDTGAFDVFVHDRRTGRTTGASVGPGVGRSDGASDFPAISADGRFVAFLSSATNLVRRDTNGETDIFVHDRRARETVRVSLGQNGAQGDGASSEPAISADGRVVAFTSLATNLVPRDTNGTLDVFVRDLGTGRTERVSVGSGGVEADGGSFAPAISADGRFVAFQSSAANLVPADTNGQTDVFVHDRRTRETVRVSLGQHGEQGDGSSFRPAISADGRVVAFVSEATNLVSGDTNGQPDIFVRVR